MVGAGLMTRPLAVVLCFAAVLGAAALWALTRPDAVSPDTFAGLRGNADAGERIFWAGGCASCHAAPDAEGDAKLVLAGGIRLESDFGTFVGPNISPHDRHGIGGWTLPEFGTAMMRGVSPQGRHYYPAFPYTAYARAEPQDIADLYAYLMTLPADATPSASHDLRFPFTLRRGLGLWKRLYLRDGWVLTGDLSPQEIEGRYLVEALAHCAECHTPRDSIGGLQRTAWMAGAPNPSGRGRIPNIRPEHLDWSALDIALYLESGFTPGFDVAGGSMAAVVDSMARLPGADREAIAAYLLAIR